MRNFNLYRRLRNINLTLFLIVFSISVLSACGKKGALYLPSDPIPEAKPKAQKVIPEVPEESTESKKKTTEE